LFESRKLKPYSYKQKVMQQETSLWAYQRATQNLGAKQKQVLDALRFFPGATNAELGGHLTWPVNRIQERAA
jgi:hypothetical protein